MKPTRPLIRYHGGKWRLAKWLISHFPPHQCYVEPFGGAASVLLQKERSYAEVYNDLDEQIVGVFRVMQNPEQRARLMEMLRFTPYARSEFQLAWLPTDCPVESARRVIIRSQMGFGSAGATKGTSGFRCDTARRYQTSMMDWVRYPHCLPPIIERMTGVQLENRPAVKVIAQNDKQDTLFYIDPPYMHDTRVMDGSTRYYRHEMTDSDHAFLLAQLLNCKGMVVLNGYENDLYNAQLVGWKKFTKESRISAHRGTKIKHEIIWINPACSDALERNKEEIAA